MASASSTLRVNAHPYGVDNQQRRQIVYGGCILSPGDTYINTANASSGIPLFWGSMQDGNFQNLPTFQPQVGPWVDNIAGCVRPSWVDFQSSGAEDGDLCKVAVVANPSPERRQRSVESAAVVLASKAPDGLQPRALRARRQ